ncbi:DNA repair protein RecO [Thermoanaerobacter mathranii subsp. mathranii str. A3]|uniref:DNA repair protein RecO n=1 Tax=Thermoanaerobacter mathranii subsp. mathranii (strain DSM 11426 / CCUG 53645 / CIP 108742 / A3) TaxID=583358 RepID=A0ABM5LPV2_THEM3|nr:MULTISPECIES: DNA repair protein RecO [Thermoanaerobacter]ADH60701.1 DNA repair protein RecO [Thermoanaerobacter mathranii subsp. mathranii str. A3]
MRLLKTEAIVLKNNSIGETDKMATLFTKNYGKLRAVAKGARRSKSRFVNAIRPFMVANYVIFEGQNYYYIDQWELIESHKNIEKDLVKFSVASYISETVNKILEENQKSEKLYQFLKHSFKAVNELQIDPLIFIVSYNLKLVSLLGYMPQLDNCIVCGKREDLKYFSNSCGGVVCTICKNKCFDARPLHEVALKAIKYFFKGDYEKLQNIKVSGVIKEEVDKIITAYMKEHLEIELKSKDFIDKLQNM